MKITFVSFAISLVTFVSLGCSGAVAKPPAPPRSEPSNVSRGDNVAVNPIDPRAVEAVTGLSPESAEGVVKVNVPRNDIKVEVDGWLMPPFMGLTSWVGFTPGQKPGTEAMIMGDLVLFEDEVHAAMRRALDAGIAVTALHNHFFFDKPRVYFMHIEGEGSIPALGGGLRGIFEAVKAIRTKTPEPASRFEGAPIPAKSAIEGAKIEAVMGIKGTAKDGMYKVVVGRPSVAAGCGCAIGARMGVNTWAAFAGTDADAVVDGDFAVEENELQPVLKALSGEGIRVVAIHHHMVGEKPRILFLHYWGRGSAAGLATSVKKALSLTKSGG